MAKNSGKPKGNVTQKEVADALGLSIMTVSRALNDRSNVDKRTKQKVLKAAEEMGYTPNHVAKSLVSNRTYTIGVVIPEISHSFFPEVVRGIDEVAGKSNFQIFLTHTSDDFEKEKEVIKAFQAKQVDGILISTSLKKEDYSFYKGLANSRMSMVFFDRGIRDLGISCIGVNDRAASRQITEHLIKKGYKSIAYLSGPKHVSIGKERLDGFIEAMQSHSLEIRKELIIENGFNEAGGKKAMQKILDLPKSQYPEAVVAVNDPVAFGAIEAIREADLRIPEDIAIVGFTNDIRAELYNPPLTTIHQPAYEVGKKAASKLIDTIEHEDEPVENIELISKLIVRKSCGS